MKKWLVIFVHHGLGTGQMISLSARVCAIVMRYVCGSHLGTELRQRRPRLVKPCPLRRRRGALAIVSKRTTSSPAAAAAPIRNSTRLNTNLYHITISRKRDL